MFQTTSPLRSSGPDGDFQREKGRRWSIGDPAVSRDLDGSLQRDIAAQRRIPSAAEEAGAVGGSSTAS